MKNEYINNHDFGYGREPELETLNKLLLRNIDDLKYYIFNIVIFAFYANIENDVISFFDVNYKLKINVKKV